MCAGAEERGEKEELEYFGLISTLIIYIDR